MAKVTKPIFQLSSITPSPMYDTEEITDNHNIVYVPTSYLLYTEGVPLQMTTASINYVWYYLPMELDTDYITLGKLGIEYNRKTSNAEIKVKNPKLEAIIDKDTVYPLTGIVSHVNYCPSVFYGTAQTPIDASLEAKTIVHEQKSSPDIHVTPDTLTSFTIDIDTDLTGEQYIYLPYSMPWSNKPTNYGHAVPDTDLPDDTELYIFKIASSAKETTDAGEVFCPTVYSALASANGSIYSGWIHRSKIIKPTKSSDLLSASYYSCIKIFVDYNIWAESISTMPDGKYLACVTGFICNIFIYGTALAYKNNNLFILNNSADTPISVENKQISVEAPYIQNAWEMHTISNIATLNNTLNSMSHIHITNQWFPICYQLTKYWRDTTSRYFNRSSTPVYDYVAEHSWVDLSYYSPKAMSFDNNNNLYPIFMYEADYGSKIIPNVVSYPNSLLSSLVVTDFSQISYIDCAYYVTSEHCALPLDFLDLSSSRSSSTVTLSYPPIFFPYNDDNTSIQQNTKLIPLSSTPINTTPTFSPFLTGKISRYIYWRANLTNVSSFYKYNFFTTFTVRGASNNGNEWGINTVKNPLVCYNNIVTAAILIKFPTGISKGSYTFTLCDKYYQLDQSIADAYLYSDINNDTTTTEIAHTETLDIQSDANISNSGAYILNPSLHLYAIEFDSSSAAQPSTYCATFASAVPSFTSTKFLNKINSYTITVLIPIITSPAIAYPQHFAIFTLFPAGLPVDSTKIIEPDEEGNSSAQETLSNSVMISAPFNNTQNDQDISNYIGLISYQYSSCVHIANCNIEDGKLIDVTTIIHTIKLHTEYVTSVEELLGICHTYSYDTNHNKISVLCVNSIVTNYFGERIQGIFVINIFDPFDNIVITFYPLNYYQNSVVPTAIPEDMLLPKGIAAIGPYIYTLSYMHNYSFLKGSLGYSLCLNVFDLMTGSPMLSRALTESSCAFFLQAIPPVSSNYIQCYERELHSLPYPSYFSTVSTGTTSTNNNTYPVCIKNTKPDPGQIPTITGLASWGTELIAYHNGQKKLCKINPVTSLIERYSFTMLPFLGTWDGTMTEYNQSLLIPLWWGDTTVIGQYPQMPLCIEDNLFVDQLSTCIDIQNIALGIPTVKHLNLVNNTLRDNLENIELSIPEGVPDNMTLQLSLNEDGPWSDSISFGEISIAPGAKQPFYLQVLATAHQDQVYISGLNSTFDRRTVFYA